MTDTKESTTVMCNYICADNKDCKTRCIDTFERFLPLLPEYKPQNINISTEKDPRISQNDQIIQLLRARVLQGYDQDNPYKRWGQMRRDGLH